MYSDGSDLVWKLYYSSSIVSQELAPVCGP